MSGLRMHHYLLRLKNHHHQHHHRPCVWLTNPVLNNHSHNAANHCGGCWGTTTATIATFSNVTSTKSALRVLLRYSFFSSSSFGGSYNSMQRCFSTTSNNGDNSPQMHDNDISAAANVKTTASIISQNKLVLGSHKWSSMDPMHYCEIVQTALANGITTIEAGQGPGALQALHKCLLLSSSSQQMQQQHQQQNDEAAINDDINITQHQQQQRPAIRILQRVGYRTTLRLPPPPPPAPPKDDDGDDDLHDNEKQQHSTTTSSSSTPPPTPTQEEHAAETLFSLLPGDVIVEEVPVSSSAEASAPVKPVPGAPRSKQSTATTATNIPAGSTTVVLHNISAAGIQEAMSTSPFMTTTPLTLYDNQTVETVLMLHNPEVQGGAINQQEENNTRSSGLILPTSTSSNTNNNTALLLRQEEICARLVESFVALEKAVASGQIATYGIVSNGLGLPYNHPLHLSWQDAIRPALERAFQILNPNHNNDSEGKPASRQLLHFSILELPVNLIETTGLQVARQVQMDLQQDDDFRSMFAKTIEIFAMRPLSAYPDLGTGRDGHSLVLADYLLPTITTTSSTSMNEMAAGGGGGAAKTTTTMTTTTTSSDSDSKPQPPPPPRMQWSHTMSSPPEIYNVALQSAMAHFDAEAILEAQQERLAQGEKADLTAEERETLDGCKLMQSLLHDVDVGLDKMRSFAVHERELMQRIIPLIYDTFEEYDDDTAKVLQTFFAAYSLAVRYAIAKNTRHLLLHGEDSSLASSASSNIPIFKDLHPDMKLQEYAIGFILKQQLETVQKQQETNNDSNDVAASDGPGKAAQSESISSKDVIDKIVVGCADPDQVIDDLELVYQFYARKMLEEKEATPEAERKEELKE